jgi:hypothetical protein
MDPHTRLWLAVLELALSDDDPRWIGTRDFHMVCTLAGFDPDAVAHAYRTGRVGSVRRDTRAR